MFALNLTALGELFQCLRFSREPMVAGIFSTLGCARGIFVRFVVYVCLFINLFFAILFFVSLFVYFSFRCF